MTARSCETCRYGRESFDGPHCGPCAPREDVWTGWTDPQASPAKDLLARARMLLDGADDNVAAAIRALIGAIELLEKEHD